MVRERKQYLAFVRDYFKQFHITNQVNKTSSESKEEAKNDTMVFLPKILVKLENIEHLVLVDTGSTVSVISEDILEHIQLSNGDLPILPATGMAIQGVTGKITKIKRQALLRVEIENTQQSVVFLVVKGLNIPVILGMDWMAKRNAKVDLKNKQLIFENEGQYYKTPFNSTNNTGSIKSAKIQLHSVDNYQKQNTELFKSQCTSSSNSQEIINVSGCERKPKNIDSRNATIAHRDQSLIKSIIDKHHNVFSDIPGVNNAYECKLNVNEVKPFVKRSYPIPYSKREAVNKEIERMLSWGILEKSDSPFSNPIVVVEKKDGTVRICLDARELNKILIQDRESPPPMEELLQKFDGVKFLTSLDLTCGYWQIPLNTESRKYTAFLVNGRSYQFCVVPFGLNVSVAVFMKSLDKVLGPEVLSFTTIYVDDILIASKSIEEHAYQLDLVLTKLENAGMTVKFSKSEFLKSQVKFLGFLIDSKGIKVDPEKLEVIQNFPAPRNKKELQSFLGFCNFYRRFAKNHSDLISRLTPLLEKNSKWKWGDNEVEVFGQIKSCFVRNLMLSHPNFNKTFYISTDASARAIGAHLFQIDDDGEVQNISFASRILLRAEQNYMITEMELLAIVFACKKFRTYIAGYPTVVFTDHKALEFLFSCKALSARLMRWCMYLQEYQLQIKYIAGKSNVVADFLSRYGQGEVDNKTLIVAANKLSTYSTKVKDLLKNLEDKQTSDNTLRWIKEELINNTHGKRIELALRYRIHEGLLFKKGKRSEEWWLICIPDTIAKELMETYHYLYGHFGGKKCVAILNETCYIPNVFKKMGKIVLECDLCQKTKVTNQRQEGLMRSVIAKEPLEILSVDLFGPLPRGRGGLTYLFVVRDLFTKYVKLYPIKKANSTAVLNKILLDFIPTIGKPFSILSDHGTQFTSKKWINGMQTAGIVVRYSSVYHPESNPVERVMRELGRLFRSYCNTRHSNWPGYVSDIENWLNCVENDSTGFSPMELLKGERPIQFLEKIINFPFRKDLNVETKVTLAREKLLSKAQSRKWRHDKNINPRKYEPGDLVLVKTHYHSSALDKEIKKFFLLYEGPYEVFTELGGNAYVLNYPGTETYRTTQNVINLKPYHRKTDIIV